ncbi:predicted protein [Sclerotinia sclerotiorum 1980 UF-70]|uniref:Mid2 domain-containing protein n=2 Tax=Sclerotinia sclerotiorum (strain ATCC 18683 / 1980 / Ss-1) TaxID=665079 RepID=A7F9Q1_SCLS1|nr:predicted protein [Sclerotinia sclerotiorum 1980 UF-70]APA16330.1 hypothetical protein sscle_16g111000 [Sclerotinia sclerotiorum 1980 UF-70]EDO00462.1 predicted protein [Sclerotinia sclerotiorum 1980 UF-70]
MSLGISNSFKSSLPHPLTRAPDLRQRQGAKGITCGYSYGDSNSPFTVPTDSTCTTVYPRGIWGLCTYSDQVPICEMYGACVDDAACSNGCYGYNFNTQDFTTTLSCMTDYCQSSLLSDSSSARLGVQTSYSCDTTSQESPALFFVSPLATPYNLITTTSSSETSATSSTNSQSLGSSSTFGSGPTPGSSFTSAPAASSSTPITPQETTVSSNHQANSSSNHTGAIIGGVIGGVALIIFIALAIWLLRRHRKTHKPSTDPNTSSHKPNGPGDNIRELMGQNGHTPEIGGTMVMAEADSPSVDRAPVEMHSPMVRREPVEMEA